MQIVSNSFENFGLMPERLAFGRYHPTARMELGQNLNPHLRWLDTPADTQSLAVVCYDPDVPRTFDDVNRIDKSIAADAPRTNFHHWGVADIPAACQEINEGEFSRGVVVGGKPANRSGLPQAVNDFTMAFSSDPNMSGQYFGYDGPCPPWNDLLIHRYHFMLFALNVPSLALPAQFTCQQLIEAAQSHVIATATITGLYTLNPTLIKERIGMAHQYRAGALEEA